jgi:Iron-sulfur cluster assembly protein
LRSHDHEAVIIGRDVEAVMVPAGVPVTLRAGKTGFLTQALGGSFTVYVEGNLFRVAGKDADALGQEPMLSPELPPDATDDDVRNLVWEQMRTCYDPEIPVNIVDLGLIYECELTRDGDGQRIADIKMAWARCSFATSGRKSNWFRPSSVRTWNWSSIRRGIRA